MTKPVISVSNLGKKYRIGMRDKKSDTIMGSVLSGLASPFHNLRNIRNLAKLEGSDESIFWAIKDVNFEVHQGEVLGIIGNNGAGKSTFLKILSQITEPSEGEVVIRGKVSSLLEVGTGFHPELTGRENVYMNGTILGMTKREIDFKFDEIVAFSGVEKHIDTPVKFYSSGMKVRLGFAVAAHLEPDILIIDEVLSVGDAEFQKKCLGKMENVAKQGRTVLFVSHNMSAVSNICSKVVLLRGGKIKLEGNTDFVIKEYLNDSSVAASTDISSREDRGGNQKVIVKNIEFLDIKSRTKIAEVICGEGVAINIHYNATDKYSESRIMELHIGLPVYDDNHKFVTVLNNKIRKETFKNIPREGIVCCEIPKLPLMFGKFYIDVLMAVDGNMSDSIQNAMELNVLEGDYYKSGFPNAQNRQGIYIEHEWKLK